MHTCSPLSMQHRTMKRMLSRHVQWPSLYWAKVRVWNVKKEEEEEHWLAFLLPHELLDCLAKYGDVSKLHSIARLDVVG